MMQCFNMKVQSRDEGGGNHILCICIDDEYDECTRCDND